MNRIASTIIVTIVGLFFALISALVLAELFGFVIPF